MDVLAPKRAGCLNYKAFAALHYLRLVYFVTALVPSLTACLGTSSDSSRRMGVWISQEVMADILFNRANLENSFAIRSKISQTNEFMTIFHGFVEYTARVGVDLFEAPTDVDSLGLFSNTLHAYKVNVRTN